MAVHKGGAEGIDGAIDLDGSGAIGEIVLVVVHAASQVVVMHQGAGVDTGEVGHVEVGRCDRAARGDRDARCRCVEKGDFGETVVQLDLAIHGSAKDIVGGESHVSPIVIDDKAFGAVRDEHVLAVGRDARDDPVAQGDVDVGGGVADFRRFVENGLHGVERLDDGVGGCGDFAGLQAGFPCLGLDRGRLIDGQRGSVDCAVFVRFCVIQGIADSGILGSTTDGHGLCFVVGAAFGREGRGGDNLVAGNATAQSESEVFNFRLTYGQELVVSTNCKTSLESHFDSVIVNTSVCVDGDGALRIETFAWER